MADGFDKFTGDEEKMARIGMDVQARAHGLDLDDPKIQAFLEHLILNRAQSFANERQMQNILHRCTFGDMEEGNPIKRITVLAEMQDGSLITTQH